MGDIATNEHYQKRVKELWVMVEEAFKAGYHKGHDDTREDCFAWCEEGTNDVYTDWLADREEEDDD